MNEDDRTWSGVLIFEVDARFQSTAEHPRSTDPDTEGADPQLLRFFRKVNLELVRAEIRFRCRLC